MSTSVGVSVNLGRLEKIPNGKQVINGSTTIWVRNGKKHRETGPAEVHRDGYEAWFKDGIPHRLNGPAITHPDGRKEYWINGKKIDNPKPKKNIK